MAWCFICPAWRTQLETRLKVVNERISSGENPSIQRKSARSKRSWHLPQPTLETEINHPFFNTLPQLDIDCRILKVF
jgi:hypothetical protein